MISRLWHRLTRSAWWRRNVCDVEPVVLEEPQSACWGRFRIVLANSDAEAIDYLLSISVPTRSGQC